MTDGFILKCFTSKNEFVTCRVPVILSIFFHFESQTSDKGLLCHKLNVRLAHETPLQEIFYDLLFAIID